MFDDGLDFGDEDLLFFDFGDVHLIGLELEEQGEFL